MINPRFIKPIDREMLAQYSRRVAAFVTFEDHVKMGGFGSARPRSLQEIGMLPFRWSALAGPTNSSSTARSTRSEPNTASPSTKPTTSCCPSSLPQAPHPRCKLICECTFFFKARRQPTEFHAPEERLYACTASPSLACWY